MAIELIHISKRFDDHVVFEDLNMAFSEGEIHCLMGASGSGKTTLLQLLMGLMKPDTGEIRGMSGRKIAAVFQEDRLIEHYDAMRNIQLVCDKQISVQRIEKELKQVGIEDYADKTVNNFSGGMRRRVAIVRAVLANSDILLLDEPFKGLDELLKNQVISYVQQKTEGKTVILVTHDKEEAQRLQANMLFLPSKAR
jgi:NitT/TauT family transport system ATP-binding protein